MPLKFRKKAILAKIESTYGTDAVPTGATDALLVVNDMEITPIGGDSVSRDLVQAYLGGQQEIPVGLNVQLDFKVEISGSGAAGTAPAYGTLLRACGFAETVNAAVDVQYDPVSSGMEALSIYFHIDGIQHKTLGSRGSLKLDVASKTLPRLNFTFTGMFVDPTDVALPTAVTTAFKQPLPVSNANTPTFTLHGYAAVMESLSLDLANAVEHRDLVNSESVEITDRASTGEVTIQAPLLATKDFFVATKDATLGALQLVHGTTAGNIVQIDAPKVQVKNPRYADSAGDLMLQLGLSVVPDAGDDELKITVK